MAYKLSLNIKLNKRRIDNKLNKAQEAFAKMVEEDTREYIPANSLSLTDSAEFNNTYTQIHYNKIYAAYQYYGKVMTDERGRVFVGRGEKKPIVHFDWDLKYSKKVHPKATSKWLEVSKKKQLKKWTKRIHSMFGSGKRGR